MNSIQIILFVIILGLVVNLLANIVWKYLPGTDKHFDLYITIVLITICVLIIVFNKPDKSMQAEKDKTITLPPEVSQLDVGIPYGYIMDAEAIDVPNRVFSVYAQPISAVKGQPNEHSQDVVIKFDITNPNYSEMRIANIYIEVIEYHRVTILKTTPVAAGGNIREFFCDINPELKVYTAKPLISNFDYVKLSQGELEYFGVNINTTIPGIYRLKVSFDYSIGGIIKHKEVGTTDEIGFF